VVLGIASVVACWLWAGRLMHLPEEERLELLLGGGYGREIVAPGASGFVQIPISPRTTARRRLRAGDRGCWASRFGSFLYPLEPLLLDDDEWEIMVMLHRLLSPG
jgi:hypothetical protein